MVIQRRAGIAEYQGTYIALHSAEGISTLVVYVELECKYLAAEYTSAACRRISSATSKGIGGSSLRQEIADCGR